METIKFKKLDPNAIIPAFAHGNDAGFDLCALEDVEISPGETKLVRTGLACALPVGYEMQVRPRSGMALKTPMMIPNSPGTVDEGYRGELGIIIYCRYASERDENGILVHNHTKKLVIKAGDRIAQGVLKRFEQAHIVEVDELDETERGEGGYGSTGK